MPWPPLLHIYIAEQQHADLVIVMYLMNSYFVCGVNVYFIFMAIMLRLMAYEHCTDPLEIWDLIHNYHYA